MEERQPRYNLFIEKYPQTQENFELAPLTAYKIGGNADLYIEAQDALKIPEIIQSAEEFGISFYLLGGGCNLVFADSGFRGLIIHNKANKIEVHGNRIIAESGAMLGAVLNKAREHELGGIMKMVGAMLGLVPRYYIISVQAIII